MRDSLASDLNYSQSQLGHWQSQWHAIAKSSCNDAALGSQWAARAALSSQTGTAARLTGLLVILFASHFLFDSAPLDQLAESTHRLLNAFSITNVQLDHRSSFVGCSIPCNRSSIARIATPRRLGATQRRSPIFGLGEPVSVADGQQGCKCRPSCLLAGLFDGDGALGGNRHRRAEGLSQAGFRLLRETDACRQTLLSSPASLMRIILRGRLATGRLETIA